MNTKQTSGSKDGMVLFAVMAIISGLAMISSTMFVVTSTDVKITGTYRDGARAFYQADAGINYVKAQIESLLSAGSLDLNASTENVSISPPSGFEFEPITNLTKQVDLVTNDIYYVKTVGWASNANTRVEVTFRRKPNMNFGVFADRQLDTKQNGSIYSYYSDQISTPVAVNSTGEGDSGANNNVLTHVGSLIDGSLFLGANLVGVNASRSDPGDGSTVTGSEDVYIGRVDPDPLGASGGALAATFIAVSTVNNNAAVGIPNNNQLMLANSETMTLTAGNYYISKIELKNSAVLNIDASAGPVNIYLTGDADIKNGTTVNFTGSPANVRIFSNSSDSIVIHNNADFKGLIYAPFAGVSLDHNGNYYGVVWSKDVTIRNGGNFYVDLSLMNRFLSNRIQLLTWKEIRS